MYAPGLARKAVLLAAAGLAGVLAVASVAAACIPYKGKMEVEGIGAGATSVEVLGSNRGMSYCAGGYGGNAVLPNAGGAGTFKVKLKASTGAGDCPSSLPPGPYGVRFWSGSPTALGTSSADYKCFSWNGVSPVGGLLVDATGSATATFQIPAGSAPGYGAVCVESPFGFPGGHRAPILLL